MIFGAVALLLAAVGLYGVMSFSVGRRRQEVGVRMALGAQAPQVVRLIFRQGARQILIGLGIGLAIAPLLSNFLRMVLFGVSPWDPATFALIVTVLRSPARPRAWCRRGGRRRSRRWWRCEGSDRVALVVRYGEGGRQCSTERFAEKSKDGSR